MVRTMSAKWVLVVAALALAIPLGGAALAEEEGWLGVMLQPLTDELIQAMSLEKGTEGVVIADVVKGSPAEAAGIEKGDVMVEMDGIKIDSADTAVEHVREKAPGDKVKIVLIRGGKKAIVTAELGARPAAEMGKEAQKEAQEEYYDIKIPRAERVFKQVGLGGGFLGLRIQSMTPDLSTYFGVRSDEGVLVLDVEEDSPAAKAGLRGGDVIIKVDNQDVSDPGDFTSYIREQEPGSTVDLTFKRKGETRRLEVEVGKMSPTRVFMKQSGEPGEWMLGENEPWMPEGMRMHMRVTERDEGGPCCPPCCAPCCPMFGGMRSGGMQEEGMGKMEMKEGESGCPMMKSMQKEGASEEGMGMMEMKEGESGCPMMKSMQKEGAEKEGAGEPEGMRKVMIMRDGYCMGESMGQCMMMRGQARQCVRQCVRQCMRDYMRGCMRHSKDSMKDFDKQMEKVNKCLEKMKPGEMGGDLKGEIEELKHEMDGLKKEMESQKQS